MAKKIKENLKNKTIEGRLKTGNDLSVAKLPYSVVEEMLRTDTDQAEDGPEGFEYRIGAFCFPKKVFAEAKEQR